MSSCGPPAGVRGLGALRATPARVAAKPKSGARPGPVSAGQTPRRPPGSAAPLLTPLKRFRGLGNGSRVYTHASSEPPSLQKASSPPGLHGSFTKRPEMHLKGPTRPPRGAVGRSTEPWLRRQLARETVQGPGAAPAGGAGDPLRKQLRGRRGAGGASRFPAECEATLPAGRPGRGQRPLGASERARLRVLAGRPFPRREERTQRPGPGTSKPGGSV